MTYEKFEKELETLKSFFSMHCHDKHEIQTVLPHTLSYKEREYSFELSLCPECNELINYSIQRLKLCPYDEKPRCRTCAKPCYNKKEWKRVATVMRYSGTKSKLLKIKDFFTFKD